MRAEHGLSRKEFSIRLGCPEVEIANIEYNKLKKPEQKESLYRNIATTFGVSLDWIKTGEGDMYGPDQHDEIAMAFGELAARKDPIIDSFVLFLRSRTPEQHIDVVCGDKISIVHRQDMCLTNDTLHPASVRTSHASEIANTWQH